mmetsp:Transcript_24597/g.69426  ORF Transcript_24597/g.69426 Transcript_24597/m.69426 type:complete len:273 (+) Transcript_24597:178-996(+)
MPWWCCEARRSGANTRGWSGTMSCRHQPSSSSRLATAKRFRPRRQRLSRANSRPGPRTSLTAMLPNPTQTASRCTASGRLTHSSRLSLGPTARSQKPSLATWKCGTLLAVRSAASTFAKPTWAKQPRSLGSTMLQPWLASSAGMGGNSRVLTGSWWLLATRTPCARPPRSSPRCSWRSRRKSGARRSLLAGRSSLRLCWSRSVCECVTLRADMQSLPGRQPPSQRTWLTEGWRRTQRCASPRTGQRHATTTLSMWGARAQRASRRGAGSAAL